MDSGCPTNLTSTTGFFPVANAAYRQRIDYPPCAACGRKHPGGVDRCVCRGTAFQIPSDRLKIERYNTIHGDKSKIPVPEPPPRQLELTMHSVQNQVQTVPSFHKNYHPLQFHKIPTFLLYFQNQFNLL